MSAPVFQSQNKMKTAYRGITEAKEGIQMRIAKEVAEIKTWVIRGLAAHHANKLVGRLALGAMLMTATALLLGSIYADGPGSPLVSEDIVADRGGDHISGDAWMYDAPFYETFAEVSSAEILGPAGDAWMFDAPFYETFAEVSSAEVQGPASDAWMFDAPFYETFAEVSSVDVQSIPGDAWMFDAPFYETFAEVSSAEIQGPAGDAWMFDAPFYEDFAAVNSVEGLNP